MVGGCNNTMYNGFSIHELPSEDSPVRRGWVKFISNTQNHFTTTNHVQVHVCSGHFEQNQYDHTQREMHHSGLKSNPPRLNKDAIPRLKTAKQPFPLEWFEGATLSICESECKCDHINNDQLQENTDNSIHINLKTPLLPPLYPRAYVDLYV